MNDRLEDLMYQAGLTAQGCWDEMDDYDRAAVTKFAELIVKECAEVSKNYAGGSMPLSIALAIKQHFGVEQ